MNKKSLTVSLAALGLIAVQCLIYKALVFIEYLLFEGSLGGVIIDLCIMIFNTAFFTIFSALICALAIPKLVKKNNIDYKFSFIQMFVLYVLMTILQCVIISRSSDFCYNMLDFFGYNLDFIYDSIYYYNKNAGYLSIIVMNMINPAVFLLGMKKIKNSI